MDKFKGLKALRKTIELVLQKLNMYQDKMNEISREELLEIMANNDLDLSWIASQESVNELKGLITDAIKKVDAAIAVGEENASGIDKLNDLIIQIGSKDDPSFGGFHVAPAGVLANNWNYTLDEDNMIVTLTSYKGTNGEVVVYDKFELDGLYYKTRVAASSIIRGNTVPTSIHFYNKIINDITSVKNMFSGCTKLQTIDFGISWDGKIFTSIDYMFYDCNALTSISNMIDTSEVTSMKYTFYGSKTCPKGMDTSKVTDASYSFSHFKGSSSGYSGLNFESVETFEHAFEYTKNPAFPESAMNVKNLNYAFSGCKIDSEYTKIIMNEEAKPTSLIGMFANMTGIKYNGSPITLKVYYLNLTEATSIRSLFSGCTLFSSAVENLGWVGPIPNDCDKTSIFSNSSITSLSYTSSLNIN